MEISLEVPQIMKQLLCFTLGINPKELGKKSESEVTQSCPTICDPMDCSLLGSSIHGIFGSGYPKELGAWTQIFAQQYSQQHYSQ